jgi:hypothetical protein
MRRRYPRTGPAPRSFDTRPDHRRDRQLAGLTVLHADKDFEVIAKITGQPVERLAIR